MLKFLQVWYVSPRLERAARGLVRTIALACARSFAARVIRTPFVFGARRVDA